MLIKLISSILPTLHKALCFLHLSQPVSQQEPEYLAGDWEGGEELRYSQQSQIYLNMIFI